MLPQLDVGLFVFRIQTLAELEGSFRQDAILRFSFLYINRLPQTAHFIHFLLYNTK